jgi:cysteine synthase
MSKSVSEERRKILRSYGASIILTSKKEKTDGAIRLVNKLVEKHPERFYNPNQFSNKYNYLTHYYSTGPELWKQLNGNIDYFIAGIGTSGTIRGVGKYLKEKNKNIKIIGVLPEKEHGIQGLKNLEESIIPDIYNDKIIDIFINVNTEKSYKNARDLSKTEGIFAGMSSGASFLGVKKLIKEIDRGNVATIFPDGGEKYLSTNLYQNKSNSGKRASI